MRGITLEMAQKYGISTKAELHNISDDLLHGIYRSEFWRFDRLSSDRVAAKALDMGINFGAVTGWMLLQQAVNACAGGHTLIAVDGRVGPATVSAVNSLPPNLLVAELCTLAASRYASILASNLAAIVNWRNQCAAGTWPAGKPAPKNKQKFR